MLEHVLRSGWKGCAWIKGSARTGYCCGVKVVSPASFRNYTRLQEALKPWNMLLGEEVDDREAGQRTPSCQHFTERPCHPKQRGSRGTMQKIHRTGYSLACIHWEGETTGPISMGVLHWSPFSSLSNFPLPHFIFHVTALLELCVVRAEF